MASKTKQPVIIRLSAKRIGARIRTARKRRGWSQAELARLVGITDATVSAWETGTRLPARDPLVALASVLRRKVDWILFGGRDYWWRRRSPERD